MSRKLIGGYSINMNWAVYSGASKLDLPDQGFPIALFQWQQRAIEYGKAMWPSTYIVHKITR